MNITALTEGILIGFAIGAVVGPIAIVCIKQTLAQGIWAGLAVGLGAALADGIYGGIAAFGLTSICDFLLSYQDYLRTLGGIYLVYLGYTTFCTVPDFTARSSTLQSSASLILPTFLLTLTSPVTILAFLALFSSLRISCMSYATAFLLTSGVFLGSMLWWIVLASSVSFLKTKLDSSWLEKINKISGIVIMLFGAIMILHPVLQK